MYYTIYKTTNKINGKFYIGKHQTKDLNDGYLGSGKLLKRAIVKHGIKNFKKQILFIYDNEDDMNRKEKELVVVSEQSYNLCEGGNGSYSYINKNGLAAGNKNFRIVSQQEMYKRAKPKLQAWSRSTINITRLKLQHNYCNQRKKELYPNGTFKNKVHTTQTKIKMSELKRGTGTKETNSQYGTFWITDGIINKKCKGPIPFGFYKGRYIKKSSSRMPPPYEGGES